MKNTTIKQTATDITRDILRNSSVTVNGHIIEMIPDVVNAVGISQAKLAKTFTKELEYGSRNPLNAILRIFGLCLTRTQHFSGATGEQEGYSVTSTGAARLDTLLTIDKKEFEQAVTSISNAVAKLETTNAQEKLYEQEKYNDLLRRKNEIDAEVAQLRADNKNMTEVVAKQAQKMLSLGNTDGLDSPLAKQAMDLLEDFELNAKWDDIENAVYFAILKDANPEKRKGKPCILSANGDVVVKGLAFTRLDAIE